jgi:hypothetical protein
METSSGSARTPDHLDRPPALQASADLNPTTRGLPRTVIGRPKGAEGLGVKPSLHRNIAIGLVEAAVQAMRSD